MNRGGPLGLGGEVILENLLESPLVMEIRKLDGQTATVREECAEKDLTFIL